MPVNFAEQLAGNQAFVDRVLGLTENLRERPVKEKERQVRKEEAERKIGLKKELDAEAKAKLDLTIEQETRDLNSLQLEQFGREIGDIRDQKTYSMVHPTLPEKFKTTYGLTGDWKKDRPTLRYMSDKAIHDTKQKRELEKIRTEAISKSTPAPYAKPDTPRYLDVKGEGAAIKANMSQHPQFRKMTSNWKAFGLLEGDPFSDPRIMSLASEVISGANQLMYNSYNNAMETKTHNVMGPEEAFNIAMDRKLAMLHNSSPKVKDLEFLSPEDAEKQKEMWIGTEGRRMVQDIPAFATLPPELQMQAMNDAYQRYQMGSYVQRRGRGESARLYGEP